VSGRASVAALLVGVAVGLTAGGGSASVNSGAGSLHGQVAFEVWSTATNGAVRSDVFVVHADGGEARNLMPGRRGASPAWSPDGRRLAFVRRSGVWIVNGDGSGERMLARVTYPWFPTWSPDGRRVAFLLDGRTRHEVWLEVVNANGSGLRKLAAADPSAMWPNGRLSWSPDGNWIAFTAGRSIRIVRLDRKEQRIVWHCGSSRSCVDPAWSPDGRRLLFSGNQGMMIVDDPIAGRKRAHVLIRDGYNQLWSPDGRTIVFERGNAIYRMNADGSDQRRVATGHNPALSRDGNTLAFVQPTQDPQGWKLYASRINGTDERLLANNSSVDYPTWGP
jgi:Tol biopolymer transport system component